MKTPGLITYKPVNNIPFREFKNTIINCNESSCDTFASKNHRISAKADHLSFTGITQQFAKTLYEIAFTLENINEKKKENGKYADIVGHLPDSWIKSIDRNFKTNDKIIKTLYTEFGKATRELQKPLMGINFSMEKLTAFDIKLEKDSEIHVEHPMYGSYQRYLGYGMEEAEIILKKALVKAKIISKKEDIDFKIEGVGKTATVYTFNVNGKAYSLKVSHPFFEKQFQNPYHGRIIELNRAAYINRITKSIKDHNYNSFYFGDGVKGFIISDFLPSDSPQPKKIINDVAYGFEYVDNNNNRSEINGTRYDLGGIVITNQLLLSNKTMQWTYNQVMKDDILDEDNTQRRLKNWQELFLIAFENKKPNCKDIMRALIDFISILPKEEQVYMAHEIARNKFIDDDNKLAFSHYFVPKYEGKRLQIPMDEIKHIYADLVKNADGSLKKQLINQILDFPYAHQIDFFEMFAYDSKDNQTRLILKQLIEKLPKEDQQKARITLKRASS